MIVIIFLEGRASNTGSISSINPYSLGFLGLLAFFSISLASNSFKDLFLRGLVSYILYKVTFEFIVLFSLISLVLSVTAESAYLNIPLASKESFI